MNEKGKYVYCIIRCRGIRSFGEIGIGGRGDEVYTVPYRDLSAVVSDTPLVKYEPDEETAFAHEHVVDRVLSEYAVLPLKFCTIFKDEAGIRRALAKLYDKFFMEFKRLEGRVEMGVKVLWAPQAAMNEIEQVSEKVSRLKRQMSSKSFGAAHLMRTRLEKVVGQELNRKADEYSARIYNSLKKESDDSRLNSLIGHMIVNAAFLVRKDKLEDFKSNFELIRSEYTGKGFEFILSGPWPPYNFVTTRYS